MTPLGEPLVQSFGGLRRRAGIGDPIPQTMRAYAMQGTPTLCLIDPQGRLIYVGGIDDKPTNKVEDLAGATNFVRAALADAKAGRPVQTAFAQPYGCAIKYPETVEG